MAGVCGRGHRQPALRVGRGRGALLPLMWALPATLRHVVLQCVMLHCLAANGGQPELFIHLPASAALLPSSSPPDDVSLPHTRLTTASNVFKSQVVAQARALGELRVVPGLEEFQGKVFEQPQVLLVQALGGMEDIPQGACCFAILFHYNNCYLYNTTCNTGVFIDMLSRTHINMSPQTCQPCHHTGVSAVLTRSSTDVLSHVAIRARAQVCAATGAACMHAMRSLPAAALQ